MASEVTIRRTGGHVDGLVQTLLEGANDRSDSVRAAIVQSLFEIGRRHTDLVLTSCLSFLVKNLKQLGQDHRIAILNVMEKVVEDQVEENVDAILAKVVIQQASSEMTDSKDVVPKWQSAASDLIVATGRKYCQIAMEELMDKFQPGVIPHFFVVQTLGKLVNVNPYGMVPFLSVTMATVLPMLGMTKLDNLKWAFATALSRFSEGIEFYVVNIDKAEDKTVSKTVFATEFYSAYDMLYNVWLPLAKDAKLRVAIVTALGHIAGILNPDQLGELLPKLVQGMMGMYKKNSEPFYITESLCMVLDAAGSNSLPALDVILDNLCVSLHSFLCVPVDMRNALSLKNQNELLRCFSVLARTHSEKVVAFLLNFMNNPNEKIRLGTLTIVKHLINSGGEGMEPMKALVISGMKGRMNDPSNKVKKLIAQVIISMATHGYLELEGGELMIEFILTQCALGLETKKLGPDEDTNASVRSMCESVLHLISTTVEDMDKVLWPYLLEFVVPVQYTCAFGALCKTIAAIARKKKENNDEDFFIDYDVAVNIPKPEAMIARFMVMVGHPRHTRRKGEEVLHAMSLLASNLREELVPVWEAVIPKLLTYLDEDEEEDESKQQKNWEDLILKFLSKSLDAVDDEEWMVELGKALNAQIAHYKNNSEDKNFCYKCLGVVMRKSTQKEFVKTSLDNLFNNVDHSVQTELEGMAVACGYASASHVDMVLTKLESCVGAAGVVKQKKQGGFLGFIKDTVKSESAEKQQEKCRSCVMLCYGFVTLYAPTELVTSRVEAVILRQITPFFNNQKDMFLKMNLIRSTELIAMAMHQDHLFRVHSFTQRGSLLDYLKTCIKNEPSNKMTNQTRAMAIEAMTRLIMLTPTLERAPLAEVLDCALRGVFTVPPPSGGKVSSKPESYKEQQQREALLSSSLKSVNHLLSEALLKDLTPVGLADLFERLKPWVRSKEGHERDRSVSALLHIFTFYLDNFEQVEGRPTFDCVGEVAAVLVPRCTDPEIEVREKAVMCLQKLLRIYLRHNGIPLDKKDQMVDALTTLKERFSKSDPSLLFNSAKDLAKVLAKKLPEGEQLTGFFETLADGLTDTQEYSSNGACVVFNGVLKIRGGELQDQVQSMMKTLHDTLPKITVPQTRAGTLSCVKTLTVHHMVNVFEILISYPLPYDEPTKACWQILAQEPNLLPKLLDHYLEQLARLMPYEEKQDPNDKKKFARLANLSTMSIVSGLSQVFSCEESESVVTSYYPRLFSTLMLRMGSAVGVKPPPLPRGTEESKSFFKKTSSIVPLTVCTDAFEQFLNRTKSDAILVDMENADMVATLKKEEGHFKVFEQLASSLATSKPDLVPQVISLLQPCLNNLYDSDRIVVTAFFAELIGKPDVLSEQLMERLVNCLLGRLVDTCIMVRKLAVRGLGNVGLADTETVQKFSTTVLSAMINGMDDREDVNDDITLEAMGGLSKLLGSINESHIRPILINISLKIRPCFEKESDEVRSAAFQLFGDLAKFGDGPSRDPFLEQIHANLVSIFLHLNDVDPGVVKSCKHCLKMFGPLLGSESLNSMFQKHLPEKAHLHYGEFMNDVAKVLTSDLPDKVSFYAMANVSFFRSEWGEIKCNAAMFLGYLIVNLPHSSQVMVSKDHVISALTTLLQDSEASVRVKAAEAMSLLHGL